MLDEDGNSSRNSDSFSDLEPEGDDLLKKLVRAALSDVIVNSSSPNRLQKTNPVFDSTRASSKVKQKIKCTFSD